VGYNKLLYHDKSIFGLEIAQTGLKVMAVDTKKWTVKAYGNNNLDPAKLSESIEKGTDFLANSITDLLKKHVVGDLGTNRVVMSIPTARTFNRSLTLPIASQDDLMSAVQLEAEQYIPIPIGELYLDYEVISKGAETIDVLLCAVPKLIVDNCMNACQAAGLDVIMIEPGIGAVARLIRHTEEGHLPTVIIDIGAASTDIAILDKNIRVTGGLPIGGNTFTLDIATKMKVSLENAHQLKVLNGLSAGPKQAKITEALEPNLKRVSGEIKKIIRYYTERIGGDSKLEQVIIVGGGSNIPGIGEFFTNEVMMPARVASPWQVLNFGSLQQPSRQFKPRYITAAGLASVHPKEIWR
jgi:type IV pilus assembly protein PilM